MPLIDPLIAELTREAATTRKLLERVPEARFDWSPHPKSMTLGRLASHLAETFSWIAPTFEQDVMELDGEDLKPWEAANRTELLAAFDKHLAQALAAMKGQPDSKLQSIWTMKVGGKVAFCMPRSAVVRGFFISHTIHHRGQLSVYLRLLDVPLPQIYGPTADAPEMVPEG